MNIYFDNAATTPVDRLVSKAMFDWQSTNFGNPSSPHKHGQVSKIRLEEVRDTIAVILGCMSKEIIFTSGGTESNNKAIIGTALANTAKGKHLVVSAVEHPSVISACDYLEKLGFEITYINPQMDGSLKLNVFEDVIREDTILVSAMYVNNETGIIFPIQEISDICKNKGVLFHCDAVQAFAKMKIDVNKAGIDLLSFSAHKIYGPKGVGGLFVKEGVALNELSFGGGQEANRRAGTENLTGIIGLGKAVELMQNQKDWNKVSDLKAVFEAKVIQYIENAFIVGRDSERSPYLSNISFPGADNQSLLLKLDLNGLSASVGSACSSGSIKQSKVLQAMNLSKEIISSSVRFSFSRYNSMDEIEKSVNIIKKAVQELRN